MKITLDIDYDSENWEPTGEVRMPKPEEPVLSYYDDRWDVSIGARTGPMIIMRRKRKLLIFPNQLLDWDIAGIAMNKPNMWYAYTHKPYPAQNSGIWAVAKGTFFKSGLRVWLPSRACPWLPDATGYDFTETWIEHPGRKMIDDK